MIISNVELYGCLEFGPNFSAPGLWLKQSTGSATNLSFSKSHFTAISQNQNGYTYNLILLKFFQKIFY